MFNCLRCGKEYSGYRQGYCCPECKRASMLDRLRTRRRKAQPEKICPECGKAFIHYGKQAKNVCCSKECQSIRERRLQNKRLSELRKNPEWVENRRIYFKSWRLGNKEKVKKYAKDFRLKKKRETAVSLQVKPVVETNNSRLKQSYEKSIGVHRLSQKGCTCLRCGNKFNLIVTRGYETVCLDNLVLQNRSPCPFCGEAPTGVTNRPRAEKEIQKIFPNFTEMNYRPDWMDGMEIDLYDPVAKVGLEFHGIKYHSTAVMEESKASRVHREKADKCDANGVQLIQLYETEWVQKRDIVIDKLNAIFHKDMKRMYARKLKVMELNGKSERMEVSKFLDKNHIQGSAGSQWAVGLVDGYELVAVCTFKYGTGYAIGGQTENTEKYWELNRYATKLGYSIVGGLSRCIKRFFDTHVNVDRIVSFADRRWTSPLRTAYGSSGFEAVCYCDTNYQYTDLNAEHPLKNKQYMRKSNIEKRGEPCYSPEKTETEMSKELGFYKVYDAGKIRYEMSRP